MQFRLVQTRDEFLELEHDWNALLPRSEADNIFLTWEWLWSWWNAYSRIGDRLHILVFRSEAGGLDAIIPLYRPVGNKLNVLSPRTLRFIGQGSADSDYLDMIMARGRECEVLNEFWKHLSAHKRTWDVLELAAVPSTSATVSWLQTLRKRKGLLFRSIKFPCAVAELPRSWDEYMAALHSRFRTKVRTTLRQLHEAHRVRFRSVTREEDLGPALELLYDLHSRRWKSKGRNGVFLNPEKRLFYEHFTRHFLRRGWLAFDFLDLDDQPVACQLCFRYEGTLYLLQEGFDPGYSHGSVGIALRAMVFKKAIEDGIRSYNFLAGLGRHKTQWIVNVTSCENIVLGQKTLRSAIYVEAPLFIQAVKDRIKAMLPKLVLDARQKLHGMGTHGTQSAPDA
jgi:CelD/BcsL family acetyltransferase involved in cellulose biosynthesis